MFCQVFVKESLMERINQAFCCFIFHANEGVIL